jgi:uracil-DNA glycosylase
MTDQHQNERSRLDAEIRSCERCPLAATRTHAVPGEGPVPARILFIGEAPGRNEDL